LKYRDYTRDRATAPPLPLNDPSPSGIQLRLVEIKYQLTEDEYLPAQLRYWSQVRRIHWIRFERVLALRISCSANSKKPKRAACLNFLFWAQFDFNVQGVDA